MTISATALLFILALIFGQCSAMDTTGGSLPPNTGLHGWQHPDEKCPGQWTKGMNEDEERECRLEGEREAAPPHPKDTYRGERGGCAAEWTTETLPDGTRYTHGKLKCYTRPPSALRPGPGFSGWEYSTPGYQPLQGECPESWTGDQQSGTEWECQLEQDPMLLPGLLTAGECPRGWTGEWVEPREGETSRWECTMTPETDAALREAVRKAAEDIISGQKEER